MNIVTVEYRRLRTYGEYQELPPLTDDELMDDTTREHRNAARDAAYDAVARCRDDLLKAVAD